MVDFALSVGRLLVAFFLVFLNGFFVAAEFAFVRVRPTTVDALVEQGKSGATLVQEATDNLDDYLAVSQLGITISSLGLGWIGEPAVASLIDPILGEFLPAGSVHFAAVAIGFGFVTFLHVVFGELAPKTIAIQRAERMALLVAPPMKLFYYVFVPGIVVFNGTANFFTGLIGVSPSSETEETHSEEEIMMMVTQSGKRGRVDMDEVRMIEAVFDLGDTVAREIMVPGPDVVTVSATTTLPKLRSIATEEEYTRYLVLDEEADDQIVGFVHIKDVLRASETLDDEKTASLTARELARDVLIVPEDRRVDDLLSELQEREGQMAVVIDEWGAFEGIVTIEDVVEEVVGDIQDEFDRKKREPSIEEVEEDSYRIDGGVPIEAVNEALDADFSSPDFETFGGLVLSHLGRAPTVGDRVELPEFVVEVEGVDGTRISDIIVEDLREAADERPSE